MNKFAIPALVAALALGACGETAAPTDETATVEETTVVTPTATETVVVDDDAATATVTTEDGSSVSIDGKDVDATVGEDGVKAEIKVD